MAANVPLPNALPVAVAPPQLPHLPVAIVQGFPAQGSVPTLDNVVSACEAANSAGCLAYGSPNPASKQEWGNAMVYQSAVLQAASGVGPLALLAQMNQALVQLQQSVSRMQAEKAQRQNSKANSPANKSIPKYVPGVGDFIDPQNPPANMPPADIGASLLVGVGRGRLPNFTLPRLPQSTTITINQVRLIEAWYNVDFGIPAGASREVAVHHLDNWLIGLHV